MPLRNAFVLTLLSFLAAPAWCATPLIGMAQVTRGDGVKLFILTGTYRDPARCRSGTRDAVHKVVLDAPPAGMSAKLDFLVCDAKPAGPEFAALRGEAEATRVIFFTEGFRAMPVHPRNARDEERKVCDFLRQRVLMRFGVNGECLTPGR
jgi:hypothetical protein